MSTNHAKPTYQHGLFCCPLQYWTYDLEGRLVGAPRMGDMLSQLRATVRLPPVRLGPGVRCVPAPVPSGD